MENNSLNRLFQTAGQQKKQTGTGFTNLNRIMSANQNNQLGQKVAGNIQSQIGNVRGSLQSQQQQFQTEAEKNRLDTEQNVQQRNAVLGRFTAPSSTPAQDVSEDEIKTFQKFRTGAYAGPQALKDTASLGSTAGELAAQTSNLSPSGSSELLRRTVGGGRYTQGQQKLDTLLMDRSQLKGAAREASGLQSEISRANTAAQAQAEQLKNRAKQFATETEQQLQSGISGIDAQVQAELDAAKQAETDRLARIEAIQNFAAGKTPKKDEAGNIMKDQYGNIVYDTVDPRGSSDQYAQLDNFSNLLRQQGVSEDEIKALTGSSAFAEGKSQLDKNIDRAKFDRLFDMYSMWGGQATPELTRIFGDLGKQLGVDPSKYGVSQNTYSGGTRNYQRYITDLRNAISSNKDLGLSSILGKNYSYLSSEASTKNPTLSSGTLTQKQIDHYLNRQDLAGYGSDQRAIDAAKQSYYGSRGILGEALQKGTDINTVYGNIARALANSQAAQNLTKAGVASDPLRTSYSALEKLLGKQASELTLSPEAERYQAGKFQIDPELIRRTI